MKTPTLFTLAAATAVVLLYGASNARPTPPIPTLPPPPTTGVFNYCTAGTSTNGCVATLSAAGTPSVAATSGFTITASNVEGMKNGIIRYSVTGSNALSWAPLSSSFLCIKASQQKTGIQNSGGVVDTCTGQLSLDFLAYLNSHPNALGQPFAAGTTVWVQATYKDPLAVKALNFTDGLEILLLP